MMKKKDIFFAYLFMGCFLVSAVVMAGDYLCRNLERMWNDNHVPQNVEGMLSWGDVISSELLADAESQAGQEGNGDFQADPENNNHPQAGHETNGNQQVGHEVNDSQQTGNEGKNNQQPEQGAENTTTENVPAGEMPEDPEHKPLDFVTVDYDYFDDALFVGDSRTVGIMEYSNLENATFFADSGMSVYGLARKKIFVPDMGKVTFDEILEGQQYGKIYLMLGMNELGYRFETTKERYQETVAKIREKQENAIIFLCANMHVTQEQSEKDEIYNNTNVNLMNELIASLADGETTFYLDVNELFDDENECLSEEYTSDAFHVLGKYYVDWVDWLCTKAIVLPEEEG